MELFGGISRRQTTSDTTESQALNDPLSAFKSFRIYVLGPASLGQVPALRKLKTERLHEFRDRGYRVYRVSSRDYRDRDNDRYSDADYGRSGKGRARGHNKH
jgi:hypothetical protein